MRALHPPSCTSCTNPPYPNRSLQRGSSGGRTCVWTSTLLMLVAALLAGGVLRISPVAREDRRELLHDVRQVERLAVQLVPALLADPEERVQLVRQPPAFQDEPHGIRRPLRGMRHARRQEEDLSLVDGDVARPSVLEDPEHDVALELIEELLPLVDVIVAARVRSAHHRHQEVAVAFPDLRVA